MLARSRHVALVLALCLAGCAASAATRERTTVPTKASELMSDPVEYQDRPISAAAGAEYFGETGLGDPYATGLPYPVLLAMMRAYPAELGGDWGEFARKFGFLERDASPPLGFHLTQDPITLVPFVMMNCAMCHAERLRVAGKTEVVMGLGNKRVRIHAYDAALMRIAQDPGFTPERLGPLAREEATRLGVAWPEDLRAPILAATVRNLRERARLRRAGVDRLAAGLPGRVATIEGFMLALPLHGGRSVPLPPVIGWAKIPDIVGTRYRDTLSFDAVGTGAPTVLAVEADFAAGAREKWFDSHRHLGTSLYLFLHGFERQLPFPGTTDPALAERGHQLFLAHCASCHGRYEAGGAVRYRETVVPIDVVGTDRARLDAVTPEFVEAANAMPGGRGLTHVEKSRGYVPPPLVGIWARAPYGHAGQWPSLRVLATAPEERPRRYVVSPSADYDLDAVGVRTRPSGEPSDGEYVYDGTAPGFGAGGHPFLADLGPQGASAVIEYLKGL